jgi:GT2 family glycosyltransferase
LRALISVVIPTHNRPDQLRACLAALAASHYAAEGFEVVVVDDGGSAPLEPIIDGAEASLRVRLVRQDRAGPAAARNRGAGLARGELLVFTDDDCLPEPDWLSAMARHAQARPGHLIGGMTVNALQDNAYSAASQHLVSYLYAYSSRQASSPGWRPFFTSNNIAVPVAGFEEVGGFDAEFPLAAGEDRDFCDRWAAHGLPMAFAPDARIRHAHRLGAASFWRQHWNYGRGAYHFHRARARRGSTPMRPQPVSFYLNLLRYPFSETRRPRAVLEAALLGTSQLANALGYYREMLNRRLTATRAEG